MTTARRPWSPGRAEPSWLAGRTRAELDVLELEGRAVYQEALRRRSPKTGEVEEIPVRLRPPSPIEMTRARIEAAKLVTRMVGADRTLTMAQAEEHVGPSHFTQLETICVLSTCLRDAEPPHGQFATAEQLLDGSLFPRSSLLDLWDRASWYQDLEDVRASELTEDEFWAVLAAIAEKGNLGPLVVLDGVSRERWLTGMACLLHSYRTCKSCSACSEHSTQALFPPTTSPASSAAP